MATERAADAPSTPVTAAGPSASATAAAPTIAPPLARRMASWLYEGLLLLAVMFIAGWLFSALAQVRDAMDARRPLLQAFLFVVFGIYFTWFWWRGQTLAMKTWKIRVVDAVGRPLTQRRALLRYACSWLWFLPPLALLAAWHVTPARGALIVVGWVVLWSVASRLHPQRQFWHDALAGTRLVSAA
jgi:uncharacterized RDD family membrane protein YckC